MQPWSSALSACSGAWDALWLMKREGQGEGGVCTANRRGVKWWCGCKSMGQHVTLFMKDLCVCEGGRKKEKMVISLVHLTQHPAWCVCLMEYKPFQLRTLLKLFSAHQYFHKFNLSKLSLSLICATMALITGDERTYILFLVPAQVMSSTVECYSSRCWEFQALF